jgi:hypothetical protein
MSLHLTTNRPTQGAYVRRLVGGEWVRVEAES